MDTDGAGAVGISSANTASVSYSIQQIQHRSVRSRISWTAYGWSRARNDSFGSRADMDRIRSVCRYATRVRRLSLDIARQLSVRCAHDRLRSANNQIGKYSNSKYSKFSKSNTASATATAAANINQIQIITIQYDLQMANQINSNQLAAIKYNIGFASAIS